MAVAKANLVSKLPIIFRFDASHDIGLGHAYRCFALIEYLALIRGIYSLVISTELPDFLVEKLRKLNTHVVLLEHGCDELLTIKQLSQYYQSRALFIDGYQFDEYYRRQLKSLNTKILCFDDLNSLTHLHSDLVINAVASAKQLDYSKSAPDATLLLGLPYSIIRNEFITAPKITFKVRKKLLINFGGSDVANLTIPLIEQLAYSQMLIDKADILVVTGGAYQQVDRLGELCHRLGIEYVHNSDDIATLLIQSKMAICAPGAMVYELAYCGVPSIFMSVADNQFLSAKAHQQAGWCQAINGLQKNSSDLALKQLNLLWSDQQQLQSMSLIASSLVDGLGVQRIVEKIEELIA